MHPARNTHFFKTIFFITDKFRLNIIKFAINPPVFGFPWDFDSSRNIRECWMPIGLASFGLPAVGIGLPAVGIGLPALGIGLSA